MGILSQEIVASGKSLRPSGGKANPRVTATPITGSNTIWPTITALRTKSRKGRSSDDIPVHANAINAIVRELMISFVWRAKSRVASFGKWLHGEVKSGAGISNRRHKAAGEEIEVHEARKKRTSPPLITMSAPRRFDKPSEGRTTPSNEPSP
jgi:hypothetical protein